MNSFCHYAIGGVGEWLYSAVLGIVPDEEHPGYEEFDIKPYPGGSLSCARGSYDSIRGRISVERKWEADRYAMEALAGTVASMADRSGEHPGTNMGAHGRRGAGHPGGRWAARANRRRRRIRGVPGPSGDVPLHRTTAANRATKVVNISSTT